MNQRIIFIQENLSFKTVDQKITEITKEINSWIKLKEINNGILTIFVKHTSASLIYSRKC